MATTDTLVATESFIGHDGKEERVIRAGDPVRASDPAVKKWPDKFRAMTYPGDHIEQATAAPGEKRA